MMCHRFEQGGQGATGQTKWGKGMSVQPLDSALAGIVRDIDPNRLRAPPSAAGILTRLAWTRARQAGLAIDPLLKTARLTAQQIEERARLSVQSQIRFVDLAAGSLHDEFLGFHLGRDYDLREIGLLHYVLASCELLGEALQRGVRYATTVNEGALLKYIERQDAVAIAVKYVGVTRHSDRHQIEFWVTTMVRACRELTRRHIVPLHVKLTHHRHGDCTDFNAFLGVDVEFGAEVDEIAFPAAVRDLPVVSADSYLNNLLVAYCEEALAQRTPGGGATPSDVENVIAELLPHGKARIDHVARRLGMSQRTLARRLAAQGLTFSDVLNRLRRDMAHRHVRDSDLSISQIAWLLGYQEVSAFTHAFKRWTGMTPREMRAQGRAQNAVSGADLREQVFGRR